jgi:hypothetical protein
MAIFLDLLSKFVFLDHRLEFLILDDMLRAAFLHSA